MPLRAGRLSIPSPTAILVALVLLAGPWTVSARGAGAPGDSLAEPVPLGKEASAGPLRIVVAAVVTGEEATARVAAAASAASNGPPREGDGYVLVDLRVRNAGERAVTLDGGDFALVGGAGVVRRFLGVEPPAPALGGAVPPGKELAGWIAVATPTDESNPLLLFDSLSLPGVWADRILALEEGATGAEVFELVDYRTGALGLPDATGDDADGGVWVALRLRMTNLRADGEPAYLPPNAFALVDEDGTPLPDVLALTPPPPDAAGAYLPGGSREGWVAFDIAPAYAAGIVRFLPYATDPDPRYLAYG